MTTTTTVPVTLSTPTEVGAALASLAADVVRDDFALADALAAVEGLLRRAALAERSHYADDPDHPTARLLRSRADRISRLRSDIRDFSFDLHDGIA